MTKPLLTVLSAILILLVLAGCGQGEKDGRKLIMVSIYPYELLVQEIVGDGIKVQTLIPANASPHTYNPKPKEIRDLHRADLVLVNGYGLETNLQQALDAIEGKLVEASDLLQNPTLEDRPDVNPHVWLSPLLMRQLVIQLADVLQTSFPESKETISRNATRLIAQLTALDASIRQERGTFTRTPVITYHDSFHYFFRDYGIDYLGSIQTSPGREPTPRELSALGSLIETNGVKAIYVEPQMDRRSAVALANEFGLEVIELDPLGHTFKPKSLLDVILNNWEGLKLGWQS